MAKGYWIARVDVHNMDGYKGLRRGEPGESFQKYGGRFRRTRGKSETPRRHVARHATW